MKLLKIIAEGLPLFEDKIEIDFLTESRVSSNEKHELINIFDNFYLNRTMTFTGINATGKTQVLKIITFIANMLQAQSINRTLWVDFTQQNEKNYLKLKENSAVKFTCYLFFENYNNKAIIGELITEVIRIKDSTNSEMKLLIKNESLKLKTTSNIRSKNNIFDFNSEKPKIIEILDRNNERYIALSDDISIINVLYNLKKSEKFNYDDMLSFTDFNIARSHFEVSSELIKLLDPSIEELKFSDFQDDGRFNGIIKFINNENILVNSIFDLENVLSSGTIKGIGLFKDALRIIRRGGIFIVDELENHLNREIVLTFVALFTDRRINKNGAILIYSTHYSELLDFLPRNDSIYITNKNNKIGVSRLSKELKRNDIKRSEQFIKGILKNTAPLYKNVNSFKRSLISDLAIEIKK